MTVTLIEMLQQGDILRLLGMVVIFGLMVYLFSKIGNDVVAVDNVSGKNNQAALSQVQKTGDSSEITAVISAAVNEYRKNK